MFQIFNFLLLEDIIWSEIPGESDFREFILFTIHEHYLGLPQITDFVKVSGKEIVDFRHGIAHICSLISFHWHMASACHILYSNTDIMLLGLDRCSSVMRLRLMIRDRIFLWTNERSTQIVARHEGRSSKVDYHKKNHFRKSSIAKRFPCKQSPEIDWKSIVPSM